jgi:hypothetical protein
MSDYSKKYYLDHKEYYKEYYKANKDKYIARVYEHRNSPEFKNTYSYRRFKMNKIERDLKLTQLKVQKFREQLANEYEENIICNNI